MYTVNKGPSKLVAKTRGGLSQNFEKIETIREMSRKCAENGNFELNDMQRPRPVFQQQRSKPNTHHQQQQQYQQQQQQQQQHHQHNLYHHNGRDQFGNSGTAAADIEEPSPQHEELVKFIRDSWNSIAAIDGEVVPTTNTTDEHTSTPAMNPTQQPHHHQHNGKANSPPRRRRPAVYHDEPPSPLLKDFGAFDLESWWGRRLFNNITKSL